MRGTWSKLNKIVRNREIKVLHPSSGTFLGETLACLVHLSLDYVGAIVYLSILSIGEEGFKLVTSFNILKKSTTIAKVSWYVSV